MEVALALLLLVVGPWILFHHVWVLVGVVPLWGFLVFQSRSEPLFLKFWAGQMLCEPYYHS
jgi:hypothetical protein